MNYQILYMFLALLTLSIVSTVGNVLTSRWICYHWYMWGIHGDGQPDSNFSSVFNEEMLADRQATLNTDHIL